MHERIVWRILPRSIHRLASCNSHKVACRRAGGASLCSDVIPPVPYLLDLRSFKGKTFSDPIFRNRPAVIHLLEGTRDGVKSVISELDTASSAEEKPLFAIVTHRNAWIYMTYMKIIWLTPRTIWRVRSHHEVTYVMNGKIDTVLIALF